MLRTFCLFMLCAASALAAPNLFEGTWKLNPSKSRFGDEPRGAQTVVIQQLKGRATDALQSKSDMRYEDGRTVHTEWTATLDGSTSPLQGDAHYDTISIKKIDDRTLEVTSMKEKDVGRVSRWTISNGGKTMTRTQKITTPGAKPVDNVIVLEKK